MGQSKKGLPYGSLTFPRFAKDLVGEEVLEKFAELQEILQPFEITWARKDLSPAEKLIVLQDDGILQIFETLPMLIECLKRGTARNNERLTGLRKRADQEREAKKINEGFLKIFESIDTENNLFGCMVREITESISMQHFMGMIAEQRATSKQGTAVEDLMLHQVTCIDKVLGGEVEADPYNNIRNLLILIQVLRALELEKNENGTTYFSPEEQESMKQEANNIAETCRFKSIEPSEEVILSDNSIPQANAAMDNLGGKFPCLSLFCGSGIGLLNLAICGFHQDPDHLEDGFHVSISRLDGELTLAKSGLASLRDFFKLYNLEDVYEYLRLQLLEMLETAIKEGKLHEIDGWEEAGQCEALITATVEEVSAQLEDSPAPEVVEEMGLVADSVSAQMPRTQERKPANGGRTTMKNLPGRDLQSAFIALGFSCEPDGALIRLSHPSTNGANLSFRKGRGDTVNAPELVTRAKRKFGEKLISRARFLAALNGATCRN